MRRTVSAMEARKKFGELLESVYYRGDQVTIERAGKVMAILVPAAEYEELEAARQAEGKRRFFEVWDQIRADAREYDDQQVMADVAAAIRAVRAEP